MTFKVGDRVTHEYDPLMRGTVVKPHGTDSAFIKWDDGREGLHRTCFFIHASETALKFKVGDRVRYDSSEGLSFYARVVRVEPERRSLIGGPYVLTYETDSEYREIYHEKKGLRLATEEEYIPELLQDEKTGRIYSSLAKNDPNRPPEPSIDSLRNALGVVPPAQTIPRLSGVSPETLRELKKSFEAKWPLAPKTPEEAEKRVEKLNAVFAKIACTCCGDVPDVDGKETAWASFKYGVPSGPPNEVEKQLFCPSCAKKVAKYVAHLKDYPPARKDSKW